MTLQSAGRVSSLSAMSASTRFAMPVPGLFALFASAGFVVLVPGLSVSFASAGSTVLVSCLSALFASAGSAMPVLSLSTPSASAPLVSAVFGYSGSAVLMPGLSASAAPVFGSFAFSVLVVTPTPGRQKFIELNQKEKRATSEELAPAFNLLLQFKPPFSFSVSCVGKKRSFYKVFGTNYRLWANNQLSEDVDLSFTGCQCPLAVKANRLW